MQDLIHRLYRTKLILVSVCLSVAGIVLIVIGRQVSGEGLGWQELIPWSELGGILFGAGLLSIGLDYLFQQEQEAMQEAQLRKLLDEHAPSMADAVFRHLAHTLMGNDLAIQIEVASRQGNFEILSLQHEPDCWRPLGAGRQLKPDVFAHVANEEFEAAWCIEIDCGTESGTTIVGKCNAYLDYRRTRHAQEQLGFFPRIIFVTPESERARRLQDVLGSQDLPAGLFAVAQMSEAIEVITNLDDP